MAEQTQGPGRDLFDAHMAYLTAGDVEGLVNAQYTDDAVLISTWDVLDSPPPHVVPAGPQMIEFFKRWQDFNADMQVEDLYDFAEIEDAISFQAVITSKAGKWVLGEAWHFTGPDRKIDRHYGFCHQLDKP